MKSFKTLALAATVSAMSFSPLASAAPESYGVIFLDRSGSMMTVRPDGQTRCAYSQQLAMQKVSKFFWDASINGQQLEIKTFSSGGQVQSITNGYTDFTGAVTALSALDPQSCGGLTAIAEVSCLSADSLRNAWTAQANNGAVLRVFGATDGEENDSPVTNCGGANWQTAVWNKFLIQQPSVQFNMTIFTGNVKSASFAAPENYVVAEDVAANPAAKLQSSKAVSTFDFFKQLAAATGGTVEEINDSHGSGEW